VLQRKSSFWERVKLDLSRFSVWAASNSTKVVASVVLFLLLARIVFIVVERRRPLWAVMPFVDLTGNEQGQAVSDSIVSLMHEARLVHLDAFAYVLNASEEIDLPSFRAPSCTEALASSLKVIDSLDVSGVGLPLGSSLAAAVRWLDMGRLHITGSLQRRGQNVCLSAQLREGRKPETHKTWTASCPIDDGSFASTLFDLERDLAFQILYDTQEGWGASTATSLRLFTEALEHLHTFQKSPAVQKQVLQKAANVLEEVLSVDPCYITAKYNLAIIYHNLGEHKKSIDTLKSLQLLPNHGLELEIAYNLGVAYYHSLNYWAYDYAEHEFRQVVEAIAEPDVTWRGQQLCALAHSGLASVYAQKMRSDPGDLERYFHLTNEHYAKALDIASENPQVLAVAHTAMGMALLNRGQSQEAAEKFEQAVWVKPDYWRAYIHWGRAEMAHKDFERAVLCLKQAVVLHPSYEFAWYQLGLALKRAKRFEEAVEALDHASSIAQAHDERGYLFAEYYQDYEVALEEFERALELKPNLSNAMVNIAWYTLEAGYDSDRRLDRALQCAQEAVKLDKESANIWHRHSILGRVYLACNQLAEARSELEKAIQLNKRAAQSHYFLALVHERFGELKKAEQSLAEFLAQPQESLWYKQNYEIAMDLMRRIQGKLKAGDRRD
jgi:tetratricopeptide (TPR) repeat protein